MHRGTVMVENRKRTHTQAVATKLEPDFFGLFIVQHPSESCYYGNQPGPCPAEVLVTFSRRKTHNERWGRDCHWFVPFMPQWWYMRKLAWQDDEGHWWRYIPISRLFAPTVCFIAFFPSISGDDNTLVSEQVQSRCMTPNDVSPSHENCCRMSNDMNSQYRRQWFLKVGEALEQCT